MLGADRATHLVDEALPRRVLGDHLGNVAAQFLDQSLGRVFEGRTPQVAETVDVVVHPGDDVGQLVRAAIAPQGLQGTSIRNRFEGVGGSSIQAEVAGHVVQVSLTPDVARTEGGSRLGLGRRGGVGLLTSHRSLLQKTGRVGFCLLRVSIYPGQASSVNERSMLLSNC